MSQPSPAFDTGHPSGHLLIRSCRGGCLHSVVLTEAAMDADADSLAQAILLTADVSHLKAVSEIRGEIVAAGHTPSAALPTGADLERATVTLHAHRMRRRGESDA